MGGNTGRPGTTPDSNDDDALQLAEANALAAAAVFHVADRYGLRAMVIKGLALEVHDLRRGHVAGDVDILEAPLESGILGSCLRSEGWAPRTVTTGARRQTLHATTLFQQSWPNDLDIHVAFPGLLVEPAAAFGLLWERRQKALVAGQPCWVPDRSSSIVIWALHSVRGTQRDPRHTAELRQIREVVLPGLSVAERQELADRIVELGADEPLRVVPEFAEIIGDRHGPQAPGALDSWNAKVAQAHEATPWLQVLRDARPSERPWLLFRAVWPSAHDLRLLDESLVDTPLGRVQSRGRRAWRLVRRIVERRRQAH